MYAFIPVTLNPSPGLIDYSLVFLMIFCSIAALFFAWYMTRISLNLGLGVFSFLSWIPVINIVLMRPIAEWKWIYIITLIAINPVYILSLFYWRLLRDLPYVLIVAAIILFLVGWLILSLMMWRELLIHLEYSNFLKIIISIPVITILLFTLLHVIFSPVTYGPVEPPSDFARVSQI